MEIGSIFSAKLRLGYDLQEVHKQSQIIVPDLSLLLKYFSLPLYTSDLISVNKDEIEPSQATQLCFHLFIIGCSLKVPHVGYMSVLPVGKVLFCATADRHTGVMFQY